MRILETFTPETIHKLSIGELNVLCDELRTTIYETVTKCGGHLSSNLGAVESIAAICRTFDFPKDKIVFDVGHQCYAYKLLTGRYSRFGTLRQEGGISGFPKREESEYDSYDTGHAGTALSAALGMAKGRDLSGEEHEVIAYIGDGSFNNGLIYEALNSLRILNTRVLIVLNDNGMSISPTVGGMHDILTAIRTSGDAEKIKLLESFSLKYIGVKNGNDLEETLQALEEAKEFLKSGSVLLHLSTIKGKGYEFSEEHPEGTHGVSPACAVKEREYSEVLGETLFALAEQDKRIVAVTAAMTESLGLKKFFDAYPERAFDVGICEEHACVLCSSLATTGMKPYYAIYSTFLQRAFDEIIHDVCAQELPVTFCIDRAGISGADGETHQGVFDLSYLSLIPNLTIAVPKDTEEFKKMLAFSARFSRPLAIRYPRSGNAVFSASPVDDLRWEYLKKDARAKVVILATGERSVSVALKTAKKVEEKGGAADVVNARFVKPLDEELLKTLAGKTVITIEDNVRCGGFGESVTARLSFLNVDANVRVFAYEDRFIPQGGVKRLQTLYGEDEEEILRVTENAAL